MTWSEIDVTISTGVSGEVEMVEDELVKNSCGTSCAFGFWFNNNAKGKGEYKIREETVFKKDEKGNIILDKDRQPVNETKKYYKSCGAMIKAFIIFSR